MERSESTLRRSIEHHPFTSLMWAALVIFPLSILFSRYHASQWEERQVRQALHKTQEDLKAHSFLIRDRLRMHFASLHDYAALLARDSRILALLRDPQASRRKELDLYLRDFAATLRLDKAYVLDHSGLCLVANDFDQDKTLVGTNFADRDYYLEAMKGLPASQFVVGRVSGVPGFHVSAPVRDDERLLGVVIVKIDLVSLAALMRFGAGFVTDDQGVVVLAEHPADLLRAVPQAPALSKPPQELMQLYKRERLEVLPIGTAQIFGTQVFFHGSTDTPSLRYITSLPQEGLIIHAFKELSSLDTINAQFRLRFYLAALIATFSGLVLVSIVIYAIHDAAQHRKLRFLNAKLQKQAQHDALTGCFNRRKFDELLPQAQAEAIEQEKSLALVLIDLDHFKEVNDRYGHAVGDRVLAHVARILRQDLRERDLLARYGGEEFALILPGTDETTAAAIMERLRLRVGKTPFPLEDGHIAQTCSAGVTATRVSRPTSQLLEEADRALYDAKARGRNRTIRYSGLSQTTEADSNPAGGSPKV